QDAQLFPPGQYDGDRQQLDRRPHNSWIQQLGEVSLVELLEVHVVNALAPFLLLSGLEPVLKQHPERNKYVINVSAREGHFDCIYQTGNHPHSNMAKAAMNMITRTCAERCARDRIYLSSVDTGWVTNENPYPVAENMAEQGFQPPLDEIDGAARVLDPIFTG